MDYEKIKKILEDKSLFNPSHEDLRLSKEDVAINHIISYLIEQRWNEFKKESSTDLGMTDGVNYAEKEAIDQIKESSPPRIIKYPDNIQGLFSQAYKDHKLIGDYNIFSSDMPLLRIGGYIPNDVNSKHDIWLDETDDILLNVLGTQVAKTRKTTFPVKLQVIRREEQDNVYLFPGFYTIAGEGNSGKSTFAKFLTKQLGATLIRLREPEFDAQINIRKFLDRLNIYLYNLDLLGDDKAKPEINYDIIVVDSMKHFSYNVKSNSPSIGAGILADVFEDINILSQICSKFGLVMFGIFNFYSMSDKNAQLLWNALISNSTGVFSCSKSHNQIDVAYLARNDMNRRTIDNFEIPLSSVYPSVKEEEDNSVNISKDIKISNKVKSNIEDGEVSAINRVLSQSYMTLRAIEQDQENE